MMKIIGKSDQKYDNWEIEPIFIIPKTNSVIPYPYNYLVSYPLSLSP